jgi:hypothetical protein
MASLHKTHQRNVRFTKDQAAKIERAAQVVSRRRGELVEDSTFIRIAALAEADRVLAEPAEAA